MKETLKRLDTMAADQRFPFVVYHNFVVNTPLEVGVADLEKGRDRKSTRLNSSH